MLIFAGGVVRDAARTWDALAVDRGVVVARGEPAHDLRKRHPDAEVLDLAGGCLVPGFRDGHLHPLHGGMELLGPPITGATSVDDVGRRLRAYVDSHPDERVIIGGAYDPTIAPGGRFAAGWLDRYVADRPVVLSSSDHHAVWVNSAALSAAGIDVATDDPERGRILRRADGAPLGTLLESAMDLVAGLVPADADLRRDGLGRALSELAACGIVWGQEAAATPEETATYLDAAAAGELTCRFDLALRVEPGSWRVQREELVDVRGAVESASRRVTGDAGGVSGVGLPVVTCRCVKFFVDGVIEAGTAALLEPYENGFGASGRPGDRGILNWEPGELSAAVTSFDALGFTPHMHAIGDAAIRAALDAVAAAQSANGPRDRRSVIVHTQLVDPADLHRFSRLGVIANFEPLWAKASPMNLELTNPRIGPERAARQYQMASLAATGARITFGSDWPVTSVDPLAGLAVAITRQTADGQPPEGWLPEERLDPATALAAYTSGSAYQAFEPHAGDLLAPGAAADLCWLSGDPCTTDGDILRSLAVRATWFGGRRIFEEAS